MGRIYCGIDISDRSIEVVALARKGDVVKVAQAARTELPPGLVERGAVLDKAALGNLLDAFLDAYFGRGRHPQAAVSISELQIFSTTFRLPAKLEGELATKALMIEATNLMPLSLDRAITAVKPLEQEGEWRDYYFAATLREVLDGYRQVLAAAHVEPILFDSEAAAMARSLGVSDGPAMLVDIGARTTMIAVVDRGLRLCANPMVGGDLLTATLEQKLGLSLADAEKLKRRDGFDPGREEGRVMLILQKPMGEIVDEIRHTMKYYAERHGRQVQDIFLAGGTSLLPGLPDYLKSNFSGIKFHLVDPFAQLSLADVPNAEEVKQAPILYATAVGLAMRAIGLVNEPAVVLAQVEPKRSLLSMLGMHLPSLTPAAKEPAPHAAAAQEPAAEEKGAVVEQEAPALMGKEIAPEAPAAAKAPEVAAPSELLKDIQEKPLTEETGAEEAAAPAPGKKTAWSALFQSSNGAAAVPGEALPENREATGTVEAPGTESGAAPPEKDIVTGSRMTAALGRAVNRAQEAGKLLKNISRSGKAPAGGPNEPVIPKEAGEPPPEPGKTELPAALRSSLADMDIVTPPRRPSFLDSLRRFRQRHAVTPPPAAPPGEDLDKLLTSLPPIRGTTETGHEEEPIKENQERQESLNLETIMPAKPKKGRKKTSKAGVAKQAPEEKPAKTAPLEEADGLVVPQPTEPPVEPEEEMELPPSVPHELPALTSTETPPEVVPTEPPPAAAETPPLPPPVTPLPPPVITPPEPSVPPSQPKKKVAEPVEKEPSETEAEEKDYGLGIGDILDVADLTSPPAPLESSAPAPVKPGVRRLKIEEILGRRRPEEVGSEEAVIKEEIMEPNEQGTEKRGYPWLVVILIITFLLAAAGVFMLVSRYGLPFTKPTLPAAVAPVAPSQSPATAAGTAVTKPAEPASVVLSLLLTTAPEKPTAERQGLVSRVIESDVSATASYPATGQAPAKGQEDNMAGRATGTIKIVNDSGRSFTLIVKTRLLSKDGVLFRMKQATAIAAQGETPVAVYADVPGAAGNITPTTFTIPGLSEAMQKTVTGRSDDNMQGGSDAGTNMVSAVSADDLAAAKKSLASQLLGEAMDNFGVMAAKTEVVSADLVSAEDVSVKAPTEGTVGANFKMTLTQRYHAFLIPEDKVTDLLTAKMADSLPAGTTASDYELGKPVYTVEAYDTAAQRVELRVEAPLIRR